MAKKPLSEHTPGELLRLQKKGGSAKGNATREVTRRTRAASEAAEKHQANNPERYQTVTDQGFFDGDSSNTKMSAHGVYKAMGYGANSESTSLQDHPTLPGVGEHVNAQYKMPVRSPLSDKQAEHIEKQAAMFGVTRQSARQAASAHIDAAMRRGPGHQSFYTTEGQDAAGVDHPRERLLRSASEAGVPAPVHAMNNAITSPQTKFTEKVMNPETGKRDKIQYTNDDNAKKASIAGRTGDPEKIANVKNDPGHFGAHKNTRRAAERTDQVVNQGKGIPEVWTSASPKTGPFHNSWVDPNGPDQRWTADTHSGAPLVAPHLKSEEQKLGFMGIPGVHQWIHERATEAMSERGLSSVSGTQSAHWNLQREQSAASGNIALANQHIHNGTNHRDHFDHGVTGSDGSHQGSLF